jgi:hypothetical protein
LGRPVDLVGKHEVGEDRALLEAEDAAAALLHEDVRAGDVGRHQVGRELDPVERAGDDVGNGAHEQRLAEAGHSLQQRVAAGEEGDQRLPDEIGLAHDHPAHLGLDGAGELDEPVRIQGRGRRVVRCRRGDRQGGGLVHHFASWPVGSRALK